MDNLNMPAEKEIEHKSFPKPKTKSTKKDKAKNVKQEKRGRGRPKAIMFHKERAIYPVSFKLAQEGFQYRVGNFVVSSQDNARKMIDLMLENEADLKSKVEKAKIKCQVVE